MVVVMRKMSSFGVVCLLIILILPSVQSDSTTGMMTPEVEGIFDTTLIMGTILNPVETNETLTANALYLFYFESGLLVDKAGIVKGFQEISLTKTPFFLMYQPGPFHQISYVYGFVKDFTIHS
jgi:hypothetical protein